MDLALHKRPATSGHTVKKPTEAFPRDLDITDVWIYYDTPLVFISENPKGDMFLGYSRSETVWWYLPFTFRQIESVRSSNMPLKNFMRFSSGAWVATVDEPTDNLDIAWLPRYQFKDEDLPHEMFRINNLHPSPPTPFPIEEELQRAALDQLADITEGRGGYGDLRDPLPLPKDTSIFWKNFEVSTVVEPYYPTGIKGKPDE